MTHFGFSNVPEAQKESMGMRGIHREGERGEQNQTDENNRDNSWRRV